MSELVSLPVYESPKVEILDDPKIGRVSFQNTVDFWAENLEHPEQFTDPSLLTCEAAHTRSYKGYLIYRRNNLPAITRAKNLSPNHPVGSFSFRTLASLLGGAKFENGLVVLRDFEEGFKNLVVFFSRKTTDSQELNDFVFNPLRDFSDRIGQPLGLNITLVEGTEGVPIYVHKHLTSGKITPQELARDIKENLV